MGGKKDYCKGASCTCDGEWVRATLLRPDYGTDAGSFFGERGLCGMEYNFETPKTLKLPLKELATEVEYTNEYKWKNTIHPVSKDRIRKAMLKQHRAEFEETVAKHKSEIYLKDVTIKFARKREAEAKAALFNSQVAQDRQQRHIAALLKRLAA